MVRKITNIIIIGLIFCMGINAQTNKNNVKVEETEKLSEVKFKFVNQDIPLILVPVYINGKGPYDFILDTGASQSIISVDLAKELGIKGDKSAKGIGAGGEIKITIGTIKSFGIGKAIIENQDIAIGTSEDLENGIGQKINGIVGYDYFKNFRLTIDYPKSIITIEQSPK